MSSSEQDHKVIQADKKLQMKAGVGDVDKKAVESAQTFSDNNKVVYAEVVTPLLHRMRASIELLTTAPAEMSTHIKNIKSAIMDMKASAATFSYPLISRLCNPLLLHLENSDKVDKETRKLIELLYHIVSIVVKNDESELGKALSRDLETTFLAACAKIARKNQKNNV